MHKTIKVTVEIFSNDEHNSSSMSSMEAKLDDIKGIMYCTQLPQEMIIQSMKEEVVDMCEVVV